MGHELSAVTYEATPSVCVRWHEYADLFPWIEGKALEDLTEDVRQRGIVEPIIFLDGAVLDGRNRYMAARSLGIEYPRADYLGDDPLGFVIAKNLYRRHLTDQQRAMVAGKLAKMPAGRPTETSPDGAVSNEQAAAALGVSKRSVERAKAIQRDGAPELVTAVEKNEVSLASGVDLAALPVSEQIEVLRQANPKALNEVVKQARAKKQAEKKAKRAEREKTLAAKHAALPDKRYGVIVADPEWAFDVYSEKTGMDRAAANHYPVSSLDTIMARDVKSIAANDSILFLWVPVPHLMEGICVLDAWGFALLNRDPKTGHLKPDKTRCRYVSHWAWLKEKIITGYWNRGKHEVLLVATRGSPVAPAMGEQLPSWMDAEAVIAPSGEHSAKPEVFLEWIEKMWPNTPKIELNRRGQGRVGWAVWGNEAEPSPFERSSSDELVPA